MLADLGVGAQQPLINVWAPLAMSSGKQGKFIEKYKYKKGPISTLISAQSSQSTMFTSLWSGPIFIYTLTFACVLSAKC